MIAPPPPVRSAEGNGRFPRGIHPEDGKALAEQQAVQVLTPKQALLVPLLQHLGAPAQLSVKPGQEVASGELLAEAQGMISAPVHAPCAGKIGRPVQITLASGKRASALTLTPSAEDRTGEELWESLCASRSYADVPTRSPESIRQAISAAGIVGQGGAGFPTVVKLTPPAGKQIRRILVNGCECEPYLCADARLMEEAAAAVVKGALLAGRCCQAQRIVIAVEDNKQKAIAALKAAAAGSSVRVRAVQSKYPMGGEKQVIRAVFDRIVPNGGLPLDVGVAVINTATAASITLAVESGRPLTHRVVSVTGPGIVSPVNVFCPVGTPTSLLLSAAGGLHSQVKRVLSGGPMMGFALPDLNSPISKGSSGIVALAPEQSADPESSACLRCGRCVDACPLNLMPARLAQAARHRRWDLAKQHHLSACMECGCCAHECPAHLPLVQLIRSAKSEIRRQA